MELKQFESMISFATGCKYSSLSYVDYDDVNTSEVICYDKSLLLLHKKSNDLSEIHYATDDLKELLTRIKVNNLNGLIKFVPIDAIDQFEFCDFKIHCAYQDFHLKDLERATKIFKNECEIKFATFDEAKEISDISKACSGLSRGFFGETEAWVKDWLTENDIIVIYMNGTLIGFCCVSIYAEGTTLWIREIAVHPDFQGKGIGKELLGMSLQYGLSKGAKKSFLAVDVENKTAIQLYEYFGFEAKANEIEVQMIKV